MLNIMNSTTNQQFATPGCDDNAQRQVLLRDAGAPLHLLHLPQGMNMHWPCAAELPLPSACLLAASGDLSFPPTAAAALLPCTGTVVGSGLGAGSALGSVTVSTPLSTLALMSASLTLSGTAKERQKEAEALHCGAWGGGWQRVTGAGGGRQHMAV